MSDSVLKEVPVVITDINGNEHWEVILYCCKEEWLVDSTVEDLIIQETKARRVDVSWFDLKSGNVYISENVLKYKLKGRKPRKI